MRKPISFDDLLQELQGQKTVQEDPKHIALDKLFPDSFMRKHSRFSSFEEFLENGNFQVKTHEDIRNIPDELFDRHIARVTDFSGWDAMLEAGKRAYQGK